MNTYSTIDELARMEGGTWKRSFQDDRRGFSDRLPMQGYRRFQDNRLCFVRMTPVQPVPQSVREPEEENPLGTILPVASLIYDDPVTPSAPPEPEFEPGGGRFGGGGATASWEPPASDPTPDTSSSYDSSSSSDSSSVIGFKFIV